MRQGLDLRKETPGETATKRVLTDSAPSVVETLKCPNQRTDKDKEIKDGNTIDRVLTTEIIQTMIDQNFPKFSPFWK